MRYVAAALLAVALCGCAGRATSRMVRDCGLSIQIPSGWDTQIGCTPGTRRQPGFTVAKLANFRLRSELMEIPGRADSEAMTSRNVRIVLIEYGPNRATFPPISLPIQVGPNDASGAVEGMPLSHGLLRREVAVKSRSFDLWVEFARRPPSRRLVDQANAVLRTLKIEPRR